ncbi:G2/mitotic-specific cyclin, partial [Linderina pennispora]
VEEAPTAKEKHDWDDLDADDADDPMMVSEYIEDIIEYLRDAEPKYLPCTEYMSKQRALTWDMRRILVDWIIQIHYKFRMQPETLFLAINIVDRFLSKRHVAMSRLQLAGLTGLLIASKYEETTTPHIDDFIFLAGNCYTTKDVMAAEVYMLTALGFDMAYPNPMTFLRRVSKAEQYNIQTRTIAKYLLEVGLIDYRLMVFPPSHVAAAGICLARRMLRSGKWDANLRHYSGFTEEELQPCIDIMVSALLHAKESEFVFKKYTHRRFLRASLFCQDWVARHSDEFDLADLHIRTFVAASAAAAD